MPRVTTGQLKELCRGEKEETECIIESANARADEIMRSKGLSKLEPTLWMARRYGIEDIREHLSHFPASPTLEEMAESFRDTRERDEWRNLIEFIVHEKVEIAELEERGYEPCEVEWPKELRKCRDYRRSHKKAEEMQKIVGGD